MTEMSERAWRVAEDEDLRATFWRLYQARCDALLACGRILLPANRHPHVGLDLQQELDALRRAAEHVRRHGSADVADAIDGLLTAADAMVETLRRPGLSLQDYLAGERTFTREYDRLADLIATAYFYSPAADTPAAG